MSNAESTIHRLFLEILLEIFLIVRDLEPPEDNGSSWDSEDGTEDPGRYELGWILITHVCRRWRQAALGYPSLWSYMDLETIPPLFVEQMLFRSGACPLTVYFPPPWNDKYWSMFALIAPEHHRIRVLQAKIFTFTYSDLAALFGRMSCLETLTVLSDVFPTNISDTPRSLSIPLPHTVKTLELKGSSVNERCFKLFGRLTVPQHTKITVRPKLTSEALLRHCLSLIQKGSTLCHCYTGVLWCYTGADLWLTVPWDQGYNPLETILFGSAFSLGTVVDLHLEMHKETVPQDWKPLFKQLSRVRQITTLDALLWTMF
ncbi:hypothetical protein OF83DRAFT_1151182, partial [Amylostereum chailletii]